ncbi:hypothetical protein ACFOG5_20675 [Pedobacter fastidiosus]|uniref:Transglutaminase-like superfamily protein n=1 Tax=Pedobacter fastidiosus TaxID=2765361 RepID=A0ABR7KV66_9SPHI|nr:hypothetical protein [Pedobacter fastidiosus]MBC6111593.1 hypothetical protein [Pedobacter fastidiosus]
MPKYLILLLFWSLMIFVSCQNHLANFEEDKAKLKDSLFRMYSNKADSVKREAVLFLIDNMDETQTVTYPYFFNKKTKKHVNFNLLEIAGEKDFREELKRQNIGYKDTTVNDAQILTAKYLASCIDKAYADWKNYPWNRHVTKEIFFNYLLPYKVYNDKPSQWRDLLAEQFHLGMMSLARQYKDIKTEEVIEKYPYFHIVLKVPDDNNIKISKSKSFDELMAFHLGDCLNVNLMNVYELRALGIPATVDMVYVWGRKNGSHSASVYQASNGKMTVLDINSPSLGDGAKVIRYSYANKKIWSDTISKLMVNPKEFAVKYLMSNHWIDVTSHYGPVGDITYKLTQKYPDSLAYICAFYYGNWVPIFWGKKNDQRIIFKNMRTDIFYRIAVPLADQMKFVSEPFLYTKDKQIKYFNSFKQFYSDVNFYKTNTGYESYVQLGSTYTLSYLDRTGKWMVLGRKEATGVKINYNNFEVKEKINQYKLNGLSVSVIHRLIDNDVDLKSGITFNNVPKNALLKLQKSDDVKGLARIFLIDSLTHKQIWY